MLSSTISKSIIKIGENTLKGIVQTNFMAGVRCYDGCDFTLDEIRSHLAHFPGGSIDLKLDEESGLAEVCLNNPVKKNAITGKMMIDLENTVNQLEAWQAGKGVIMYGSENTFCSGGDLDFAQKTGSPEGGYKMAKFMHNVLKRFQELPMISAAFVDGFALGGGAELAISCDYRLFANQETAMGFVHTRMGIIPAWGGLTAAVQILGYRTALDLVASATMVRTDEALRLGLCDAVLGDINSARSWMTQRTRNDASAVRAVKAVANYCRTTTAEDARMRELKVFSPLWGGPANKRALSQKLRHK